jgi:hypothetical protein
VKNLATLCIARSHLCSIGDQDVDTNDFSLKNGNERLHSQIKHLPYIQRYTCKSFADVVPQAVNGSCEWESVSSVIRFVKRHLIMNHSSDTCNASFQQT